MSWHFRTKTGRHAWSNPNQPLPDDADLFNVDFLNQFISANNERRVLTFINDDPYVGYFVLDGYQGPVDYYGWNPIQPGFDVQARSFYFVDNSFPGHPGDFYVGGGSLQGAIQAFIGHKAGGSTMEFYHAFLKTEDLTDFSGSTVADAEASWWDIASFNADMGFPANSTWVNFRRTRIHPSDPQFTGFEHGMMQTGDIIGPWIFEDLRRAYARLRVAFVGLTDRFGVDVGETVSRHIQATPGTYAAVTPPETPAPSYADRRTITNFSSANPGIGYFGLVSIHPSFGPRGTAIEDQLQQRLFLLLGINDANLVGKQIEFDCYLFMRSANGRRIDWDVAELVDDRVSNKLFSGTRQTATLGGANWVSPWIGSDALVEETGPLPSDAYSWSQRYLNPGGSMTNAATGRLGEHGTLVMRLTNPEYP